MAQRVTGHGPARHQLARSPQPAHPHPRRCREPASQEAPVPAVERNVPEQYPVLRRTQTGHRPSRGRHVHGRRNDHHQRRHDDVHDGRVPGRQAPQDPDQFVPDGGTAARLERERDHRPRREGLPRAERDPVPVRQRHHPAPLRRQDVHERLRPVAARPDGSGSAADPGGEAPDQPGGGTDRAGRQFQVRAQGGPDPVRSRSRVDRHHGHRRVGQGRPDARAVRRQ
ncbi:conserved hypothetical protein, partial [Ricinus communis]